MFDNNRKTALVGALTWALLAFIGTFFMTGGNVYISATGALLGIPAFLLGTRVQVRYREALAERAERPATDTANVVWDVYMNEVHVGTIADDRIATIEDEVANDWRNAIAQAVNVLRVPLKIVDQLIGAIPAIAFWLILACAILAPESLTQAFTEIAHSPPQEIKRAVAIAMQVFFTAGLFALCVNWMIASPNYGLRNVYRERLDIVLRRELQIASTGRLTLSRLADATMYFYEPTILGWVRARSRARTRARARQAQ
ncbi:hypothetical protein [Burkholderia cenocepacia]|uniref:hypothetical protein n=1 Tax=Burkholderia cenocepacia TaxID=95486 RepID=UPI0013E097A5|nr:hypothetical protein [Burkholderia cenocepacia]MCW3587414.1 hypothetical protein [Burkholderia cenocepacia]MCW3633890.1 hypothetical protein [Burkholderia cenocepacia]MCW5184792.1 hypothetical protein [Burkholderia cenocepacia]NGO98022.1 hypothetical protein [Burkholderia cenocepacia]